MDWKRLKGVIKMSFIKIADKVRDAYDEIESKSKSGRVTPQEIVEYAEPEDSPLHNQFEWNDKIAGHHFRVWQARGLINKMTFEANDSKVREYHNLVVEVKEGKDRGYYKTSTIMKSEDLKGILMRQMLKELKEMERKYGMYAELFEILDKKKIKKYQVMYS